MTVLPSVSRHTFWIDDEQVISNDTLGPGIAFLWLERTPYWLITGGTYNDITSEFWVINSKYFNSNFKYNHEVLLTIVYVFSV